MEFSFKGSKKIMKKRFSSLWYLTLKMGARLLRWTIAMLDPAQSSPPPFSKWDFSAKKTDFSLFFRSLEREFHDLARSFDRFGKALKTQVGHGFDLKNPPKCWIIVFFLGVHHNMYYIYYRSVQNELVSIHFDLRMLPQRPKQRSYKNILVWMTNKFSWKEE